MEKKDRTKTKKINLEIRRNLKSTPNLSREIKVLEGHLEIIKIIKIVLFKLKENQMHLQIIMMQTIKLAMKIMIKQFKLILYLRINK